MNRKLKPQENKPTAQARDHLPVWTLFVVLAATFAAYAPALNGPFLFDDLNLPMLGASANDPWTLYASRVLRSLSNISLVIDKTLWGLNPFPYHLENLLLHLLNGCLVFLILKRLLSRAGAAGRTAEVSALFGCAVFLLHPMQTEAVAYIASRSEVLCVLFAYLAYLFVLTLRERGLNLIGAIITLILLGLGMLSKEPAIAMAGVLLLTDLWFGEKLNIQAAAANWRLYGIAALGGAAVAFKLYSVASREGTAGATASVARADYLVTQCKVVWAYLRMTVLPFGQNIDHTLPITKAPGDVLSWLGLAGLLTLAGAAFVYRRRYPLATLGILTTLILLTPTSSIIPIDDAMAERRLYLGFIGLAMVAAEAAWRFGIDRGKVAALAGVAAIFGLLTAARASDYSSTEAMWSASVKVNPANARAHFHLAHAYYLDGRCADSVKSFEQAAARGKLEYSLLVDWALALDCAGDSNAAILKLKQATTIENSSHAWSVMGMVYGKQHQTALALEALDRAIQINPADDAAHVYKGNVYVILKQKEPANAEFDAALQINPANEAARQGKLALQSEGQ